MDRINRMGRDMCKDRPDHPRCKAFKDKPTEEPTSEPEVEVETEPPAPAEETTASTTASTTVNSSMQEIQDSGNYSSSLDSWGKPHVPATPTAPA
eukprot:5746804-Amphidinium_carterae.1